MDQSHSTTTTRKKGQYLTYEERVTIQLLLKDGWKPGIIANELGCAPNTVRNEIKRGTVDLYSGHVQRYKAEAGQKTYESNRQNCCRHCDFLEKERFIEYTDCLSKLHRSIILHFSQILLRCHLRSLRQEFLYAGSRRNLVAQQIWLIFACHLKNEINVFLMIFDVLSQDLAITIQILAGIAACSGI